MDESTYVREYDKLHATSLTREMHERTCGYWYTVTSGAIAHTAFKTREELNHWLAERGLELFDGLAPTGEWSTTLVAGSYRKASHTDAETFNGIISLFPMHVMDNGEWTPAKVTEADGIRTVHYMNVNYRERSKH